MVVERTLRKGYFVEYYQNRLTKNLTTSQKYEFLQRDNGLSASKYHKSYSKKIAIKNKNIFTLVEQNI